MLITLILQSSDLRGINHKRNYHKCVFTAFYQGDKYCNYWKSYSPRGIGVSRDENCIHHGGNVLKIFLGVYFDEKIKEMRKQHNSPMRNEYLWGGKINSRRRKAFYEINRDFTTREWIFICYQSNFSSQIRHLCIENQIPRGESDFQLFSWFPTSKKGLKKISNFLIYNKNVQMH